MKHILITYKIPALLVLLLLITQAFSFAQSNGTPIPLYKNSEKGNVRIEFKENKKFPQVVEVYCNKVKAYKGMAKWQTIHSQSLKSGTTYIIAIQTPDDRYLYFSENGQLPLPDTLFLRSNIGTERIVSWQHDFLILNSRYDFKPDSIILYNLLCQPVTSFFNKSFYESYDDYRLIIEKDGKTSMFKSGSDKPVFFMQSGRFVSLGVDYPSSKTGKLLLKNNDSTYRFIDTNGNKLNKSVITKIHPHLIGTSNLWLPFKGDRNIGLYSLKTGEEVEPQFDGLAYFKALQHEKLSFVDNQHFAVRKPNTPKYAFLNNEGKVFTGYLYENYSMEMAGGKIACKKGNKFGVIDDAGAEILPFEYNKIQLISGWSKNAKNFRISPAFTAKKDSLGKYALFNSKCIRVSDFIYEEVKLDEFTENLVATSASNKMEYYFSGDPITDVASNAKTTFGKLIINYNRQQSAFDEEQTQFEKEWNAIVEKKGYSDEYKSKQLSTLILKYKDNLLAQVLDLIEHLNYHDENYRKELSEKNYQSLKKNLLILTEFESKLKNLTPNPSILWEVKKGE